jgi:tetratricopeptide (TPR) repeat protein
LRTVGERKTARAGADPGSTRRAVRGDAQPVRRRRRGPSDIESELLRLGGRRGNLHYQQLLAAADAFSRGRDRDALRTLRPVRDALPDAASVRELMGLIHYRIGNFNAAITELEAFVNLSNSVEQHPVLMDCYRARRRWRRVEELWEELAAASPSAELVTEGRIVLAGSLADRGRLGEAIAQLDRKAGDVKRPRDHHLRLWYALADLEERAGNLARARELFARVRRHDPDFADVALRSAALR